MHKTIINNINLNYDGDLLATASEKVNLFRFLWFDIGVGNTDKDL